VEEFRGEDMTKTITVLTLSALLLALRFPAEAQEPKKMARVGLLTNSADLGQSSAAAPFQARLRELGYVEGQNITFETRYWEGKIERLPKAASELVRLNCDVIFTTGNEAARAAKTATKNIPIVIANTGDAVKSGFVASLAQPGGNVTGLTSVGAEFKGKQLEILKEVVPRLSRVGYLWSPTSPNASDNLKETEAAARSLRIAVQSLPAKTADDIRTGFQTAVQKRAEAILMDGGGFFAFHQKQLLEAAAKSRLPTLYANARYVEAGGLMTYAADRNAQYRRAAEYVDKILKGVKPADLPVERPIKFEFVINLKAAKQIGLTIPPNVLARADKVIK
jgi:putative tryptophan/tyrosine transport system substrate-binding protein